MPRRAVFLDRDGVLNRAIVREGLPHPPQSLSEFELIPAAREACAALKKAGFILIIVTNQPDVARGTQTRNVVESINAAIRRELPIDDERVCYHDDRDRCDCRKPEPGLILRAAESWHVDLAASYMVGDRWRDVEAGKRAGCRTVFIDNGYSEAAREQPDHLTTSIEGAAEWILSDRTRGSVQERERGTDEVSR